MRVSRSIALVFGILTLSDISFAAEKWTPMFNGRDFSGWTNVNCAPSTWTVREDLIVSTGIPTGVLRTMRQYENFIIELEWKHLHKGGNAGLFIWGGPLTVCGQPFTKGIEVQVLDHGDRPLENAVATGHGDVFAIHGATMLPDRPHPKGWARCLPGELRAKPAGEWNHYRVECRDGRLSLAVNGKVVSGASNCIPRKGYICLESEGSECHFRNIRIQELPSSNPPASEIAELDQGFRSLYTGVDFSGWKYDPGHEGHWVVKDWILDYDGKSEAKDPNLSTEKEYGDFILIVDWRSTRKTTPQKLPVVLSLPPKVREAITSKIKSDKPPGQWNRLIITRKGDRLSVALNDKYVIENVGLPGAAARGPIALQHHEDGVQFANIYIKEL
jgi:hypothetical protein